MDSDEDGKQPKLFQIEKCVESKDFGSPTAEYHVQYKPVDMETVDIINLHIKKDQDRYQRQEHNHEGTTNLPVVQCRQWQV